MHPYYETYYTTRKPIDMQSTELRFMKAVCAGNAEAAEAFFADTRQFDPDAPFVDAPHGRYTGKKEIGRFAKEWLGSFSSDRSEILPVVQTKAGGRSVTEMIVSFFKGNELTYEIPMLIVGDLRVGGLLDGARLYFHFQQAPGFSAYRPPIFQSQHLTVQEPHLLTGAPRAYLEAIHHEPAIDIPKVLEVFADGCCFGGFVKDQPIIRGSRDELKKAYEHMSTYIPKWLNIRFETVIDDGITCVIEWVHVITRAGREEGNRLCESGVAVYERNEEGKLGGIRICDYAHCEHLIDWTKEKITKEEAEKINYLG